MPGDVAGDAAGDAAGDVADTIARLTGELEWCRKEITRLELLNHSLLAEKSESNTGLLSQCNVMPIT